MKDKNTQDDGIRMDLLRKAQLEDMTKLEKVGYIIDSVQDGCVIILESGLEPEEEALLVEKTMHEIDHDKFKGIEIESYPEPTDSNSGGLFGRVLNRDSKKTPEKNLMVIGPRNRVKTLHKDEKQIQAVLNP